MDQIQAAIAALETAIITHETAESRAAEAPGTALVATGDSVRLRAHATPLIELFE